MLTMLGDLKKNMKIKDEWMIQKIYIYKKRPKWRYSYSKLVQKKKLWMWNHRNRNSQMKHQETNTGGDTALVTCESIASSLPYV